MPAAAVPWREQGGPAWLSRNTCGEANLFAQDSWNQGCTWPSRQSFHFWESTLWWRADDPPPPAFLGKDRLKRTASPWWALSESPRWLPGCLPRWAAQSARTGGDTPPTPSRWWLLLCSQFSPAGAGRGSSLQVRFCLSGAVMERFSRRGLLPHGLRSGSSAASAPLAR